MKRLPLLRLPLLFTLCAILLGCQTYSASTHSEKQPEAATGYTPKDGVFSTRFMVATANPWASQAAHSILQAGGSATDASIAAQLVLTLVEPQSSGLGGGALMLHWDGLRVRALDGREQAPLAASPTMFQTPTGQAIGFYEAVLSGQSIGVPGTVRLMERAHQQWGTLPWARLFDTAIDLAKQGFPVSPRLHGLLKLDPYLRKDPSAAALFYLPNGEPKPIGTVLKNPALAQTFETIAQHGAAAFYQGPIANNIINAVRNHPNAPGSMTDVDLRNYRAKDRPVICKPYRSYQVCGFAPPSSGGIAIAQMLTMLERFALKDYPPKQGIPDANAVYWMSEAGRLAFADRAAYVADTDFAPLNGTDYGELLNQQYLQTRSQLIGPTSLGRATAGTPPTMQQSFAPASEQPEYGTSHISIVDAKGHAISMTSTIEDAFGSRTMVNGFLLNNQLTDFDFLHEQSTAQGSKPIANRVQGAKRPRSSMSPTFILNQDGSQMIGALGSPGGSLIINYVLKTIVGLIDWQLSPQEAVNLPNLGSRNNGVTELEKDRFPDGYDQALKAKGQQTRMIEQTSGTQVIWRVKNGWLGGADPRREGLVLGDSAKLGLPQ